MYDKFRTLAQVLKAYKRKRNIQYFIIEAGSRWNPTCVCCNHKIWDFSGEDTDGKPMHPPGYAGNRCTYNPRTKSVRAMHYVCAMGKILNDVAKVARVKLL